MANYWRANYWWITGELLVNYWRIIGGLLADSWWCWQIIGDLLVTKRGGDVKYLTNHCTVTLGIIIADCEHSRCALPGGQRDGE